MNGSVASSNAPVIEQGNDLPSKRGHTMKKIEIRKTGPVRLTSVAHALYGGGCGGGVFRPFA
jgi:hypothetical protein